MRNTIIAYYEGAYGPTVRIDVQTKEWLLRLRNDISRLLSDAMNDIDFAKLENIEFSAISGFKLVRADKNTGSSVTLVNAENLTLKLYWTQDHNQLNRILGLIDGLISANSSGHQYLSNEEGGLLIELAYME